MLREFIFVLYLLKTQHITKSENSIPTSGFYTDGIDSLNKYQIVYPEKTSKDGSFVSYYLPHFYDIDSLENRPRRTSGHDENSKKDEIHFVVPINGEKHHLELRPNWNFIAPGLVVERRDARDVDNINKAKISQISSRQCHYSGEIVGQPKSSVALSTCYGLAGYIKVPTGDEFFIEPVKDSKPDPDKEHPHIIYKRSGSRDRHGGSNCLTKGKAQDALAERLQWEALYGEQVRKEMSGININDLVRDNPSNKFASPSQSLTQEKLSVVDPFQRDMPQVETGKSAAEYAQKYGKVMSMNSPQNVASNEEVNHNQYPADGYIRNNWPVQQAKSKAFYTGSKLKHKNIKEEMNMGNINLPDASFKSAKSMTNKIISEEEVNMDTYQSSSDHQRKKRDLSSEFFDQNESPNTNFDVNGASNSNILKNTKVDVNSKDTLGSRSLEEAEKSINKENNPSQNLVKDGYSSNYKLTKQNKRELDNLNKDEKTPLERNVQKRAQFNDENAESTEKKSEHKKIMNKREFDDESNQPFDDCGSNESFKEINKELRKSIDEKGKNLVDSKDLSVLSSNCNKKTEKDDGGNINDQSANIKRDIHLDTSEKSWKNIETPSKLAKQVKSSMEEERDKLGNFNDGSNTLKNMQSPENSIDSKDRKPLSLTKVDKTNLNSDEKIMASVLENLVKDMDKSKVKKEIGISDEIGLVMGSSGIVNSQNKNQANINVNPQQLKATVNEPNEKYIKFDQICLTENENKEKEPDSDSKKLDSNKNLVFITKESSDDTLKGKEQAETKGAEPLNDNEEKMDNSGDEIVIRIKSPQGMISDVSKQNSESNLDNMRKDNSALDYSLVSKDLTLDGSQSSGSRSLKTAGKPIVDLNKRGVEYNLTKDEGEGQDLHKSPEFVASERDAEKTSDILDSQKQFISPGSVEGKGKTKRDDTIHLVIETDPAVSVPENSNSGHQRENLFCQGKNCLEIKPVLLNDTNLTPSNTNNVANNSTENLKVIKRQVDIKVQDDCKDLTSTEPPLICFDFYSKMFNLELMITVDYKVVKMHDDDDIENFILTIINMVSTNFYDSSIGINLSVFLVRLILLTTCIKELDSDRFNPEELLENFCTWQVLINPGKDDHPHHHDLAIFVTRMDKCEGQVMGVTYMTSVCRPDKACLVCVDEGLLLANTITHQIGHALGADHDENESSGCSSTSPDGTIYHMAPTITETSTTWSSCSRDAIIQFVKTQGSWCLTDLPVERQFSFPLMLPGQIYSAAQQCKLNFHMTALPCSVGPFCERLYCQVTEKLCATKGDPPADGTFCASDMWCFHKQCVHIGRRPGSVNGEWGPWTEWSLCTRSCGGGISTSFRICNNPKPGNGGRFCIGDRIRHRMCAIKPCQGFTESFRDLQCKRTEDRPFRGRLHNWIQYHSFFLNIECALVCQNRKGEVVMRSPIVADGTPCKAGTRNVCIQGLCRNVGCDWVIDSNAKEDACGVCQGNGTECRIIQGIFDEPTNRKGLVEFLHIPKNSGMIFVREVSPSANVLVVSGSINRVFYLNGMGTEEGMPGDVSFGQAHGVYEVRSAMERIFIRGPTSEELIFYVQFRESNKGIHYQYAVPETDPTYIPRYLWQYLDWDPCTDPCSGGSQRARAKCVEDRGGVVDDQYCTESSRPIDMIRPCNDFPCQAKWWVSVWSDCICTGSSSVMFRSVLCMRATDESGTRAEVVKESECSSHKKPPTQKPCNTSEDDECYLRKRAIDDMFRDKAHTDIRRSLNSKMAYSAFLPAETSGVDGGSQDARLLSADSPGETKVSRDVSGSNKKKPAKIANVRNAPSKIKPSKSSESKESLENNKRKVTSLKDKEVDSFDEKDESKSHLKNEESLLSPEKGIQVAKLNSKDDDTGNSKNSDGKQVDDAVGDSDSDSQCGVTKPPATCETPCETETTTANTCRHTCPVQAHRKTTCCKTSIKMYYGRTRPADTTTIRPFIIKMDELNMNNFALTVVPLDLPGKKRLPQTDPEFIHLGNIGQFGVADESNATIMQGQEALDFLEFARSNASEEPVILHEDMHQ